MYEQPTKEDPTIWQICLSFPLSSLSSSPTWKWFVGRTSIDKQNLIFWIQKLNFVGFYLPDLHIGRRVWASSDRWKTKMNLSWGRSWYENKLGTKQKAKVGGILLKYQKKNHGDARERSRESPYYKRIVCVRSNNDKR